MGVSWEFLLSEQLSLWLVVGRLRSDRADGSGGGDGEGRVEDFSEDKICGKVNRTVGAGEEVYGEEEGGGYRREGMRENTKENRLLCI